LVNTRLSMGDSGWDALASELVRQNYAFGQSIFFCNLVSVRINPTFS
jgi:hypothetical protein